MLSPLCICSGVMRSGSTWSYNVCREMFQQLAARTHRSLKYGFMDSASMDNFVINEWPLTPELVVFKSHEIGLAALGAVQGGNAKAVVTFRDPRDCVASYMIFKRWSFENTMHQISGTVKLLEQHANCPHSLFLRYEDMMTDRRQELWKIASHLRLHVDEGFITGVDGATNMDASRKICESMKDRPADNFVISDDHKVDPKTHLHENHFNGGTIGRWKNELSPEQTRISTEFFASWLLRLNYETPESLEAVLKGVPVA
jgi:hypothetical protein